MKLLKKLLCGILSAAMLITSASIPAMAADDIAVSIDLSLVEFDVPPQIINDRTMVPMRAIFEALGAAVDWDGDTRTITANKDDITIITSIGNETIFVNEFEKTMDVAPCIIDDRTLVPVRFISEALGYDVEWLDSVRTIVISTDTNETEFYSDFETVRHMILSVMGADKELRLVCAEAFNCMADEMNKLADTITSATSIIYMTYATLDLKAEQTVLQFYKFPDWENIKNNMLQACDKVLFLNADDFPGEFTELINLLKTDATGIKQRVTDLSADFSWENFFVDDMNTYDKENELLETILINRSK